MINHSDLMVPVKKKPTLDNILDAAHQLFLGRGFSATSLDVICKKAKVTKGGFFHYFKSKECLGKAVLQRFCSTARDEIRQAGCEKHTDPLERVFAALDCLPGSSKHGSKHQGCLIATFIQEMSQTHPEIQSMCVDSLREWASMIKEDLRLAKESFVPDSPVNVESLANYCVTVVEGAQVLARATGKKKDMDESIKHLKNYLTLIFKPKQT